MSEYNMNKREEIRTINYLREQDVLLSKPVIVRNLTEKPNSK
jgi:hypothetical protein